MFDINSVDRNFENDIFELISNIEPNLQQELNKKFIQRKKEEYEELQRELEMMKEVII